MSFCFLYVTTKTKTEAEIIASILVTEKLVACANILDGMKSIYRWKNKIEKRSETVLLLKTSRRMVKRAHARIVEVHSYECPCILELPITGGHAPYLAWLKQSLAILVLGALLLTISASRQAQAQTLPPSPGIMGRLQLTMSPWQTPCRAPQASTLPLDCGLPAAHGAPQVAMVDLAPVRNPGESARVYRDFIWPGFAGRVTIYSVYPQPATRMPPYLQIRMEITTPARALCIQSVRWRIPAEIPPLICAATDDKAANGEGILQWGLNLSALDASN